MTSIQIEGSLMVRSERLVALVHLLCIPLMLPYGWVGRTLVVQVFLATLALLVFLWVARTPSPFWKHVKPDIWDICMLACGAWMVVASMNHPPSTQIALAAWSGSLLTAIYLRHSYGTVIDFKLIFNVAVLLLTLQVVVSLAQIMALSNAAGLGAYLAGRWDITFDHRFMVGGGGVRMARALGVSISANKLGCWLAVLIPFALAAVIGDWHRKPRYGRLLLSLLLLLSAVILIRNFSRLAIIAGAVGVVSFLILRRFRPERRLFKSAGKMAIPKFVWALPFLIIGLTAFGFATYEQTRNFSTVAMSKWETIGQAFEFRYQVNKAALSAITERPWFGWGYGHGKEGMPWSMEIIEGMSPNLQRKLRPTSTAKKWRAHNLFLVMAMEGGIPVAIFSLTALGLLGMRFVKQFRRRRISHDVYASSLIAALVLASGYLTVHQIDFWPFFLVLQGCLMGSLSRSESTENSVHS